MDACRLTDPEARLISGYLLGPTLDALNLWVKLPRLPVVLASPNPAIGNWPYQHEPTASSKIRGGIHRRVARPASAAAGDSKTGDGDTPKMDKKLDEATAAGR